MQKEREFEGIRDEEDFKNLIFANNLKLYDALFVNPVNPPPDPFNPSNENEIKIPETIGDVANLLSDLKELGVDLSETEL